MGSSQRRPHRPVSGASQGANSQVMRQQIAPWAGFILSRPGEVWVPGTSIPGEAGSQPGPLLVNLCGRPETAGFSHPHRWTSDGCQPALLPRDTTTLYRDDRRGLAATADRRATCGNPPRAVYTAKEAKRLTPWAARSPPPGPGGNMGYQREPRTPLSASPKVTITIPMTCIVNISFARSGFHQLSAHAGQGPALQPRDVHLGEADPGRDGVLVQVLKERSTITSRSSSGRVDTRPGRASKSSGSSLAAGATTSSPSEPSSSLPTGWSSDTPHGGCPRPPTRPGPPLRPCPAARPARWW
jgi:hypothetical protein